MAEFNIFAALNRWTVRNLIERLAAIRRDKIVLGDVKLIVGERDSRKANRTG